MTKYILTAIDLSLDSRPRRMWIFDNKEECFKLMDFLSQNSGWSLPEYLKVEEIIVNGKEYL